MKAKITPKNIKKLNPGEVFVFGSNTAGRHGKGAAKLAYDKFGASYGQGFGLQGSSYAIPTLDSNLKQLSIEYIQDEVNAFKQIVEYRKDLHFLITPIGTGLAGFSIEEMAKLFVGFENFENISLPEEFINIIQSPIPTKKIRIYFAHPTSTYNTFIESDFINHFSKFNDVIEMVNPNSPEHQLGYKKEGMEYFKKIVQSCDRLYAFSFGDNTIGAGIAQEMDWMFEKGGPVIFFPFFLNGVELFSSSTPFKSLTIEETKEKLRYYRNL